MKAANEAIETSYKQTDNQDASQRAKDDSSQPPIPSKEAQTGTVKRRGRPKRIKVEEERDNVIHKTSGPGGIRKPSPTQRKHPAETRSSSSGTDILAEGTPRAPRNYRKVSRISKSLHFPPQDASKSIEGKSQPVEYIDSTLEGDKNHLPTSDHAYETGEDHISAKDEGVALDLGWNDWKEVNETFIWKLSTASSLVSRNYRVAKTDLLTLNNSQRREIRDTD